MEVTQQKVHLTDRPHEKILRIDALFSRNKTKDVIDMNLLVSRKPVKVYISDSCHAGMGGYSSDGFALRWYIPEHLKFRASNNLLEHLHSFHSHALD